MGAEELREKAIKVYDYLAHLVKLRTHVVYDTKSYIECIWIEEIPHHKWCYCRAWDVPDDESDPSWVEIQKPILPTVPNVPEKCQPWVDNNTLYDYIKEPKLHDRILKEKTLENGELFSEYIELSEYPDIIKIWEKYLEKQWQPWRKEYSIAKEVQDIYTKLFSMYQQQKALGESYEVILGFGLLNWKTKDGVQIHRHIISAQIELVFEPNKGTIVVKPSSEGANLRFETEMIDPKDQPEVELQLSLENDLKELSNDVWNNSLMYAVVRSWVNGFKAGAASVYSDSMSLPEEIKDHPQCNFAPAIILRKRTNRGILQFIDDILKQFKSNVDIPENVKGLLTITADKKPDREKDDILFKEEEKRDLFLSETPLLPLQVNNEQLKIVNEIAYKKGVLVQGPPGTGKSHTIANLICHLLSKGKRVLVTSQTARALKVLKEKIPKDLQALCVSVLGNRQGDFDSLKNAVNDITKKYFSWDPKNALKHIDKLEKELFDLKSRRQNIEVSLRELREKETVKYSIIDDKYQGTAQSMSKIVKQLEQALGWIPDVVKSSDMPPITQNEFMKILSLQQQITEDRSNELSLQRAKLSDLFTPEEFVKIVDREQKYREKEKHMERDISLQLLYDKLKKTEAEKRKKLLDALISLINAITEARRRPISWLNEAVALMLGDQDQPLKELATVTNRYLAQLQDKVVAADDTDVKLPKGADLVKIKADAEDLLEHFKKGKKLGWGCFRPKLYKRVKYLIKNIYVNGRPCDSKDCLMQLIDYINVENDLQKLKESWRGKLTEVPGTKFHKKAVFSEQLEALNAILKIEGPLNEAKQAIEDIKVISTPSWHEHRQIQDLVEVLDTTFIIDQKNEIDKKIDNIKTTLKTLISSPNANSINKDLLDVLENRDWKKWGECFNTLKALEDDAQYQDELVGLLKKLKTRAEELTDLICNEPKNELWTRTDLDFESAWNWSRADAWLREFEESHDEYQLQKDFADIQGKINKTTANLASLKTWFHCFNTMTEDQRQHLMAWSVAIQRLGKGTGKRAEKHRRDAQFHMNECRSAIPGWIMPLYRVADTIKAQPEIFDVLIVDEASQSGPEALFLMYIAKKCIIVGDDQQISPEGIGVDRTNVDLLVDKFLKDIPHKDAFGPESSLFTQAEIRFGARIILREHFRCVPEIIQYSNDLCYAPLGTSLIPLREYDPDRLEPIVVKYVREGYREGKGQYAINKPEAMAVADQIAKCCKDKTYRNKTMGVISLQGDNQAKYIEKLLLEKIGPEEVEERALICGNAYDFQGDERDIIFLSMVAAPNERIGALARHADKRRFNVAVSRARDQIWLFTSVKLNDLSPNCYRYGLLGYLQSPKRVQQDVDLDSFDSDFERELYNKIKERGYNVIPHFKVAEFEIDIVVEGMKNRLAVECDGDYWHGPEEFDRDMWRQRILERAGWVFWRIRGSSFYRDPEQAIEPLWQKLKEMGIKSTINVGIETGQEVEEQELTKKVDVEPEVAVEKQADYFSFAVDVSDKKEDRLDRALEYSKKLAEQKGFLSPNLVKKAILDLLKQATQGGDLLPDNVLRALSIHKRGRERAKYKRKIRRVMSDMKREGVIEEYHTEKRMRVRLV